MYLGKLIQQNLGIQILQKVTSYIITTLPVPPPPLFRPMVELCKRRLYHFCAFIDMFLQI